MALKFPKAVLPVWRFTVHVIVGIIVFLVVFVAAVALGWVVDWAERHGAHEWIVGPARFAEGVLFGLDIFVSALFILKEFAKLIRHILLEDWEY
jgi:hypothetical protein